MIVLPRLTQGMEQGRLATWRIRPGDTVRVGDVIADIETDKAIIELESTVDGVIAELLVAEGTDDVRVDTVLARLEGEPGRAGEPADLAQSTGSAQSTGPAQSAVPESSARPASAGAAAGVPAPSAAAATQPAGGRTRLFASPVARRLAHEARIDLAGIAGTGPRGRITKRDVEDAARGRAPGSPPTSEPRGLQPDGHDGPAWLAAQGIAPGSYVLTPLDPMRKAIARRLTESARDIPHFSLTVDLDVDALLAVRSQVNAARAHDGIKVSVNDMLVKAVAMALVEVPAANASWTPVGIATHRHADIAIAVAVDNGLITPIVRAAEQKTLLAIAQETAELATRARTRRLAPEQFQGGTFSISNLGMFGVRSFNSILNPPQGCILSVGAAERRPVVTDVGLAAGTVMSVTLTCDHRVVDGATGARFLAALRRLVQAPAALLIQ